MRRNQVFHADPNPPTRPTTVNASSSDEPVTIVVRRRVLPNREAEFEQAMRGFIEYALAAPGNLGIHVLRPGANGAREFTVVDRFRDRAGRGAFVASPEYRDWMQRLRELCVAEPHIEELGGLAGWFTLPDQPRVGPPPRWKMALVTFAAVFPLALVLPPLLTQVLPGAHYLLQAAAINASMVAALTWLVMPALTRLLRRWLFGTAGELDPPNLP